MDELGIANFFSFLNVNQTHLLKKLNPWDQFFNSE